MGRCKMNSVPKQRPKHRSVAPATPPAEFGYRIIERHVYCQPGRDPDRGDRVRLKIAPEHSGRSFWVAGTIEVFISDPAGTQEELRCFVARERRGKDQPEPIPVRIFASGSSNGKTSGRITSRVRL